MSKFCINCGIENLDEANFCGNCGKKFDANTEKSVKDARLQEYDEIINSQNIELKKSLYHDATEFIRGYLETRNLYYDLDELVHIYGYIAAGNHIIRDFEDNYEFSDDGDFIVMVKEGLLSTELVESGTKVKYTLSDLMKKTLILHKNGVRFFDDEHQKLENDFSDTRHKYRKMPFVEILEDS